MTRIATYHSTDIDRVRAFAERPENLYRHPDSGFVAGDRPEYTAEVGVTIINRNVGVLVQQIRTVFTITEGDSGKRFRHATFSLRSGDTGGISAEVVPGLRLESVGLPARSAVEALCYGLGFTGGFGDWDMGVSQVDTGVIVAVQQMPDPA